MSQRLMSMLSSFIKLRPMNTLYPGFPNSFGMICMQVEKCLLWERVGNITFGISIPNSISTTPPIVLYCDRWFFGTTMKSYPSIFTHSLEIFIWSVKYWSRSPVYTCTFPSLLGMAMAVTGANLVTLFAAVILSLLTMKRSSSTRLSYKGLSSISYLKSATNKTLLVSSSSFMTTFGIRFASLPLIWLQMSCSFFTFALSYFLLNLFNCQSFCTCLLS